MGEPEVEHDDAGAERAPSEPSAFPRELAFAATLAWLALVIANLSSMPSTNARINAMDEPALTASRALERQHEVLAVLADRGPNDALGGLVDASGERDPLGLPIEMLRGVAGGLARATEDLLAAADAAHGADDDETAERLAAEGAYLGARAIVVAAAAGTDAPTLDPADFARPGALGQALALAEELRAGAAEDAASAALDDAPAAASTESIDERLAGLPELLVLARRDELPPSREWAASRAFERVEPLLSAGSLVTSVGVVAFVVLLVARRRFPPAEPRMSARLDGRDGWCAFTLGQIGFFVGGALLLASGNGGVTGFTVVLSSLPLTLFALHAAGWRRGEPGTLATSAQRLGIDNRTPAVLRGILFGAAGFPLLWSGVLLLAMSGVVQTDTWSSPYTDDVVAGGIDVWRRLALEAGLGAPIFEEIAFRGVLFAALRSRMGFAPAALVSAAVFGLQHPYDLGGLLSVTWIGFALAWLYERTGSLVACMVAHSLYNLSSLAMMLVLV